MPTYRRVTYGDRCQIDAYLQVGVSKSCIAKALKKHRSTVFREVKRNVSAEGSYRAVVASAMSDKRRVSCTRTPIVTGELELKVRRALERDWSPEQVAGRFRTEKEPRLSYQTIYRYIAKDKSMAMAPRLRRYKKRGAGRFLQRRNNQKKLLSIDQRPEAANQRRRLGDWERDGAYIAKRQQILVCTDRKSRFTKLARIKDYRTKAIAKLTVKMLKSTKQRIFTITNDNGPEFKHGPRICVPVYFCHPRKPQQRGMVENTIGLLRQYLKRDTDPDGLSAKDLRRIENNLNLRPRKCLGYKTPYEVFYKTRVALAV